ncbi:UDP-glucose 4-epimerase GalE [Sneathiella litorea]|uniref:UDP-glucose 4-epimerase n=1 Tax=Sneathiella litorea TaxID=2606216 RepID=A0A6L8WDH0_9PROT|nr:UDP-glucose 4-epimerase GalE [Sneathiella litorea]MZR32403.1 UDP-glucose 4-epimerase GalE [Sneathiella litorea]
MSVLLTGGAGYIGSHMVYQLLDEGESVVVLDNLSTGFDWAIPPAALFVKGDIADEALISRIIENHRIDAVIHFAGSSVVPESVQDPLGYYKNNTLKSCSLIASAIEGGVKHFVFSSTAAVYGMPDNHIATEETPLQPISPYGSSKLMIERILQDASNAHDFRYVALRYFNVAGADPNGRTGQSNLNATHLIKVACQASLGLRSHMEVYGSDYDTPDGTGVRDYIHVSDLVSAHSATLRYLRNGKPSEILNCGYGHGHSVLEIINTVKEISNCEFDVKFSDRRTGDAAALIAANAKILKTLDWQPKFDDLRVITQHALDWEKHLKKSGLT